MKLRHSTISAESSITELANSDPARPHHGPKDFARTLRALLSLLKTSSEPSRPRFRPSSGRRGGRRTYPINETARDYAERKRGLKNQIQERAAALPTAGLGASAHHAKLVKLLGPVWALPLCRSNAGLALQLCHAKLAKLLESVWALQLCRLTAGLHASAMQS